jgi:hypothetical protein
VLVLQTNALLIYLILKTKANRCYFSE